MQGKHQDLLIFEFVAGELASLSIENEAVGAVPVLDDIQSLVDLPSEQFQRRYSQRKAVFNTLPNGSVALAWRNRTYVSVLEGWVMFKGRRFPVAIILLCVRWYCKYGLSYRDLREMMQERGVEVDASTIMRWVHWYAPELEKRVR